MVQEEEFNSVEGFQGGVARNEIEVISKECCVGGFSILFQSFIHEWVSGRGRERGREREREGKERRRRLYDDLVAVCLFF
ncbi:hypothetical protein OIU78_013835, partial [Salix suchowensis]